MLQYKCPLVAIQPNVSNLIHHAGKLLQQTFSLKTWFSEKFFNEKCFSFIVYGGL
jgi:hypothetical protein